MPSTDVRLTVLRWASSRRSTFSDCFTTAVRQLYRCRPVKLPQACGSATARQRQSVQRPVNNGRIFREKRNNLGFSVIITKFGAFRSLFMKYSVHKGEFPSMQKDGLHSLKLDCIFTQQPYCNMGNGYTYDLNLPEMSADPILAWSTRSTERAKGWMQSNNCIQPFAVFFTLRI